MENWKEDAELLLEGRIQIETARDALLATGRHPIGAQCLTDALDRLPDIDTTDRVRIFTVGESPKLIRDAIMLSLGDVSEDENAHHDERYAAGLLLNVLTEQD